MPLESPLLRLDARVAQLNARFRHHSALAILGEAMSDPLIGTPALVSSFGADSVVLLHMLANIDRTIPVLFIDTELLFAETLTYQTQLADKFGLSDVRILRAGRDALFARDPDGLLQHFDPDACCSLRKVEPLANALRPFDAWITGRRRTQGPSRENLALFEADGDARIKINPLAHWQPDDVAAYIRNNDLPRHPLVSQGFASIGCAPCTSATKPGEDARAGRWRGLSKLECGIHLATSGAHAPKTDTQTDEKGVAA